MRLSPPPRRRAAIALACLLATGGGVAAGSAVTGAPPPPLDAQAFVAEPGSVAVDARAADPGGGPGWAVRRYRGQTGLACVEAGRFDGVAFGRADARGRVEPLPALDAGSCVDGPAEPLARLVNRYPGREGQEARTVVFGLAAQEVVEVTVATPGGPVELPLGRRRTFILALSGLVDVESLVLEAELTDGTTRRYDWR